MRITEQAHRKAHGIRHRVHLADLIPRVETEAKHDLTLRHVLLHKPVNPAATLRALLAAPLRSQGTRRIE